jgi:hypothetical protein
MACSHCANESPSATRSSGQERVRYFPRQLLTADDMRTEQEYFREKQRRHNRLLHGWGVVCGLKVVPDPATGPMAVNICPGYALGPCGDEIYVSDPYPFDLTYCARPMAPPCTPEAAAAAMAAAKDPILVVRIRYAECPTRPMRTLPAGCGCDDTACEYSRVRDGFEIQCIPKAAIKVSTPTQTADCPPCPDDPWLTLAEVQSSGGALKISDGNRKVLVSPAL